MHADVTLREEPQETFIYTSLQSINGNNNSVSTDLATSFTRFYLLSVALVFSFDSPEVRANCSTCFTVPISWVEHRSQLHRHYSSCNLTTEQGTPQGRSCSTFLHSSSLLT